MNELIALDHQLFFALNRGLANPVLDVVMPWLRNMYFWAPLYIFFIGWLTVNFGKRGWLAVGWILLTFACTDMMSSSVIKPALERLRPCNDPELASYVRLLVKCGGGFSFTSSHATNHFGFAVISAAIFRPYWRWIWPVMLIWAASISLAQVYVGVHFPLDISAGALLGSSIGGLMAWVYVRYLKLEK